MKKFVVALLIVAMVCPLFAGGSSDSDTTKIGISIPSADHGWTGGIVWWAEKRVAELEAEYGDKFEFTVITADSAGTQVGQVEDLVVTGIEYLVILPHDSAQLTPIVKEVAAQGIACIVVDRGLTDTNFGYVNLAGDNPGLGYNSGKWFAEQLADGGNYIPLGGLPIVIDTERMTAFFDEMEKNPKAVNLLGGRNYEFVDFSADKALSVTETMLQRFDDIDAIFCQDDDAMMGVLKAIEEAGRTDIKTVMGGAGSKVVMKMIIDEDPIVRATATYHPSMIEDGINYCIDVVLGNKSKDFTKASSPVQVIIPSVLVDKSNVMEYYEPASIF